ncbi:MAG: endonuclease domain-containing protein [Candidatus Omnitrophica bacterium]|nr:endonuclease domain-containing protein [Candidatus Omnitrophota bacterium]
MQFARALRKHQTDTEAKLWHYLRKRSFGGLKFRRQYVVGPYITDFCCVEKRLIIELDGGQHTEPRHEKYDAQRTEYLRKEGYKVLRFWDHDVWQETEAVWEAIDAAVKTLTPSPLP